MTSTKDCGHTITSWRQMSFNRFRTFIAAVVVAVCAAYALFAGAVTAFAQSGSPLADRIESGDRKAALEMLTRNAPVNSTQPDGTSPLHWAVYRVDEELVKALLGRGAKADVLNSFGSSPLVEAARIANANLVAMLLDADANPNMSN